MSHEIIFNCSQFHLLLQLADSAFPTGGFAHSGGLEAALQQGEVRDLAELESFLKNLLWQTGHGALPLASAAYETPETMAELDSFCDIFLSNHVANRASRVQGRTFFSTCERVLDSTYQHDRGLCQHFAPIFGLVAKTLGLEKSLMQRLLIFLTLRGTISAAVRLGVTGPYQAQRLQKSLGPCAEEVFHLCHAKGLDEITQTAPLLDLFQNNQDRLYSRLFQS